MKSLLERIKNPDTLRQVSHDSANLRQRMNQRINHRPTLQQRPRYLQNIKMHTPHAREDLIPT